MSAAPMNEKRLSHYAAIATVPVIGVAGATATSMAGDIIHYGGPAIVIDRTMSTSYSGASTYIHMSYGFGGIFSPASTGSAGYAANFNVSKSNSSMYINKRGAKVAMNMGKSVSGFAVGTDGSGLLKMVSASQNIDLKNFNANSSIAKVAKSVSAASSMSSFSTRIGDFAAGSAGEETRGYIAFGIWSDDMDSPDFGWMDIGWDGDVLTIYDWALNTNGSIHVGQTSAVPGATGLAALAMGAAGLRRRRKRVA